MSKYISLLLLMLPIVAPMSAQTDSTARLLNMLALVPDNAASREAIVSYADYRAIEAARGIEIPATDSDALLSGAWIAALGGVSSGMQLSYIMARLEEMQEVVGFSFLDIDRSLVFGNPPSMGTILAGDFDPNRISAAYTQAGYEANDLDGLTVLCSLEGCDSGLKMDLQNINPANPFGGALGRQEPLAILPDFLANSPDLNVFQAMLEAYQGEQNSLAEAPDYRAIALAAAEQGGIGQIQFVNPLDLMTVDPAALLGADSIERLRELTGGFETLPPYSLAAFADVWDGSQQRALILLAYGEEANAQTAADELAKRMETFVPLSRGVPFSKRLADLDGMVDAPAVYTDAETGYSVAIWSMRYPMPANEPEGDEPLTASSLGFRFLIDALYRRDLYVLALEPMQVE
jgi:hypothetical protein